MSAKVKFHKEVKMALKAIFGIEAQEQQNCLKVHVDELGTDRFKALAALVIESENEISLKRSGTGLTILVHSN